MDRTAVIEDGHDSFDDALEKLTEIGRVGL